MYSYSVNNENYSRRRVINHLSCQERPKANVFQKCLMKNVSAQSLTKPIHHQTMSCAESVWTGSIGAPENDLMEKMPPLLITAGASGNRSAAAREVITNLTAAIVRRITNLNYDLRIEDFTQADRRNTDIDQSCQRG